MSKSKGRKEEGDVIEQEESRQLCHATHEQHQERLQYVYNRRKKFILGMVATEKRLGQPCPLGDPEWEGFCYHAWVFTAKRSVNGQITIWGEVDRGHDTKYLVDELDAFPAKRVGRKPAKVSQAKRIKRSHSID